MTQPLRLVPPAPAQAAPQIDAAGQTVLDFLKSPHGGHALVVGPPGSGKTTIAVAAAAQAVADGVMAPERVLLIAPTRKAAAALRDQVTLAMNRPTGTPVVRTAASTGFAILAAQARALQQPPPVLLTGAEQDVVLRTLLDGHRRGDGAAVTWDGIVPAEATALAGFREELRNLLMRAAETGLTPEELSHLGAREQRPAWQAAARVYREYLDVVQLTSLPDDQGERFDPARVVADAADAINDWEVVSRGSAPQWDLVIIDDYQEATVATTALLHALARRGSRVVMLGNADQTVQGYRGAAPSALARATHDVDRGGFSATRFELDTSHRQPRALVRVTDAVLDHVAVMGEGSPSRGPRAQSDEGTAAPVTVVVAPHRHTQSRAIATLLRQARNGLDADPVAWGQMVVIARSTVQLRELRSDLLAADIPCETLGDALALHAEPAVAPLLAMLRVALGQPWSDESATHVLMSRLGGVDAVGLRRLRRALVREERSAGGTRNGVELVVDAMADPARWSTIEGVEATRAAHVVEAVKQGMSAAQAPHATAGSVLWAMWESLGLAEAWRDAAIAGSARDDADLDAIVALMRAAQVFAERLPGAAPAQFIDYLEAQDFAADSLGARAQAPDVVSFATPASAAGREWDVVVVAGVEEGRWPNLRLRDTVLGAQHLSEVIADRERESVAGVAGQVDAARAARQAVLNDETRAFTVAVSRARQRLIVTCVEGEEQRPSRYLSWIEQAARVSRIDARDLNGVADLRTAVAKLRIDGASASGSTRLEYAAMLAHLAALNVPGAHPRDWHGVPATSSDEPFWSGEDLIPVSPSKVDTVELCALKWALESVGGTAESSIKQQLGTVIHEIAAAHPGGTREQLEAALDERWHEVAGTDTWPDRVQRAKANDMIRRLALYIDAHRDSRVGVEEGFRVDIGRARLQGSADRVESDNGQATIVDLKTGAVVPSVQEALDNGQLAMYQLAANEGAFEGVDSAVGARLVFLGSGVKPAIREQPPIDTAEQRSRLAEVVDVMGGSQFVATPNDQCDHCPIQRSCPALPTGRQVSDT